MGKVYKLAGEEYVLDTDEYYIRVSDGLAKIWCYVGELTDKHAEAVLGELRRKNKKNGGCYRFKCWTLQGLTEHWQLQEEQTLTAKLKDQHPDWNAQKLQQEVLNTLLDYDWEGKQLRFKLSLDCQDLTDEQQEILSACVCAANRVRVAAGYGDRIIENKYAPVLAGEIVGTGKK